MDRRQFLRAGALGAGALLLARSPLTHALPGDPYGPLRAPDANGIRLPAGFRSRVVARGEQLVPGTRHLWHRFPDGGAVFPAPDGGWIYASNSEVPLLGGAGALRFDRRGKVVDGYRILAGTSMNCAGGPTPWGTWLSCEEHPAGLVWECDPTRPGQGVPRPALGTFSHEAVAVDPVRKRLYLTEDDGTDGGDGLYRFTPERYPDLTAGTLEAAVMAADGSVSWVAVEPGVPMRLQRPGSATAFDGAEGIWYHDGHVTFTAKGANRVWDLDVAADRITLRYDADEPLQGVDNVVGTAGGDLYVAEDGGDMQICVLTPEGRVAPVLQVTGHDGSEITGPAFDPSGTRLYFSSQRGEGGTGPGVTYEVRGPFRR